MKPILYSFRRCPYAMRARIALAASGCRVELREVVLRDKPQAFLDASVSATVPTLVSKSETIDESLDIMIWALKRNDPFDWLDMSDTGYAWIERADGPFKTHLDRTKYANRYEGADPNHHRSRASEFLSELDLQIDDWIFKRPSLADYAILPFVRQFAFIDKPWFDAQPWPKLQAWLERFLQSDEFSSMMSKYAQWHEGDAPIYFP
ncbi:MAG: glutathione S-transferase [Boseongicola sp.]|nr:glutathione S-transferase [Boseongicola sp.]NNL19575.1 glutathione S-transferase [Boseongicola sp.]